MRILFLTPYLPSPPTFGGQRRIHELATGLASSHEITLLSLVDASRDQSVSLDAARRYCQRVVTIPVIRSGTSTVAKRLWQLRSLFDWHSFEWHQHLDPGFLHKLQSLLQNGRFDIVHVGHGHMIPYILRTHTSSIHGQRNARWGGARPPRFVLDEHNIEYDILRRTAQGDVGFSRKVYSLVNWRKVRLEECRAWRAVDGCTVTSRRDEQILKRHVPEARTTIVPNGVDVEYFQPAEMGTQRPKTLLFFGAINYYPNFEGISCFLRDVFPRVKAHHPEVDLQILGRCPPDLGQKLAGPDVSILGSVDDVRPYIERAAVVVVPLRIGGGTRLKILEAMAMGKAVVSTTIGAEGLEVTAGQDILIADDPEPFAREIGRLLVDSRLSEQLGDAGRRLVEERYTWQASVRALSGFYERLVTELD
ncbi:MAG: glycosyltransferase [Bradymonadales bacterium]|nr:glycosyltransferase [Bradymonadales bacterium]